MTKKDEIDKLMAEHDKNSCLEYYSLNKDGYGTFICNENKERKRYLTHRYVYSKFNNVELTTNDVIMHMCDNRACFNPKHLKLGTHADNVKDRDSKNRQAKGKSNGRYKHGYNSIYEKVEKPKAAFEDLCGRKLSLELAKIVKAEVLSGEKSLVEIAKIYNVGYSTLKDIRRGKAYKNL